MPTEDPPREDPPREDPLSWEHHVRLRAELLREELERVWGDELPPGPHALTTLLVDAVAMDDAAGKRQGLLVQSDAVPAELVLALLRDSPRRRAVLERLPPGLRARVELAAATVPAGGAGDGLGDELDGLAGHPVPPTASGAFSVEVGEGRALVDERVATLLGLPARPGSLTCGELAGRLHPDDREQVGGALRRAADRGGSVSVRGRVLEHDGRVRWLSLVGHALRDGGRVARVVGFVAPSSGPN
ncbi:PAS domain-containing protein [Kineococcus terrestris]|uniref:PAS domain-containing protein n=1 Tax=Kineococcus terrestris TaxID=2044856 RepID=UPI0034DAE46D